MVPGFKGLGEPGDRVLKPDVLTAAAAYALEQTGFRIKLVVKPFAVPQRILGPATSSSRSY